MIEDYLALPEVQFFLKYWKEQLFILGLVCGFLFGQAVVVPRIFGKKAR